MVDTARKLVPGRECGTCSACCADLLIQSKELTKLSGVACPHCEKGCRIYETRPAVCRDYFCGWRTMPELPDDWRPDKIGVLVHVAPNSAGRDEYNFLLIASKFVLRDRGFALAVARLIAANKPTFLGVPGKPDEVPNGVFLNGGLASAVARGDTAAITAGLLVAHEAGMRQPRQKLNLAAMKPNSSG